MADSVTRYVLVERQARTWPLDGPGIAGRLGHVENAREICTGVATSLYVLPSPTLGTPPPYGDLPAGARFRLVLEVVESSPPSED